MRWGAKVTIQDDIRAQAAESPRVPGPALVSDRLDGLFGGLGVRSRVVLSQLPLTVSIALVAAAAAIFSPATLSDSSFRLALVAHLVIFAACVAIPWDRLPYASFSLIAVLDCVAIGFTREAGGSAFNVLSLLLVFPVIWLSAQRRRFMVVLAVAGTVLSTMVPAVVANTPPTSAGMIRTIFLPLVMAVIAVTAHVVSATIYRQRIKLVRSEHALAETLAESLSRQRLLDAVLGAVGAGVWVVDAAGGTVLANKALQTDPALSGLTADPGRDGILLAADKSTPVQAGNSPGARAVSGEILTDELYWAGPEGARRAYSVSSHTFPGGGNRNGGAVITFVDVTSLIGALEAKDNFVATVSHELRTPLTSILGYLELVLEEPGHEDIREELLIVHRNAKHLLGLVNDLIAVASGRVELFPQEADLAALINSAVDAASPKAAGEGIELACDARHPLPARLDPERIRQVLDNLLSNAIKYTPDGGRVTVRAFRTGPGLACTVTDTGVGMSEAEQEQAFTKFFRSARSRSTAIPGAGLGLPISRTIIEAHGGTITLAGAPGKGTTATFTLPAP